MKYYFLSDFHYFIDKRRIKLLNIIKNVYFNKG